MTAETPILRPGDRIRVTPASYEAVVLSGNATGQWSARRVDAAEDTLPDWYGAEFRGGVEVVPTPAPVSSGVDDLRDRIADAIHAAQCGCDDWAGHETVDGYSEYVPMAYNVLVVVGPELARHDAETARLSTALRDMARRLTRLRRTWASDERHRVALVAERDRLAAELAELRKARPRVWRQGDPEPIEPGLRVLDEQYQDSWHRREDGRWTGLYGHALVWPSFLRRFGPVSEVPGQDGAQ